MHSQLNRKDTCTSFSCHRPVTREGPWLREGIASCRGGSKATKRRARGTARPCGWVCCVVVYASTRVRVTYSESPSLASATTMTTTRRLLEVGVGADGLVDATEGLGRGALDAVGQGELDVRLLWMAERERAGSGSGVQGGGTEGSDGRAQVVMVEGGCASS